jgi:hypothetical protein
MRACAGNSLAYTPGEANMPKLQALCRCFLIFACLALACLPLTHAQGTNTQGTDAPSRSDGGGRGVLESIYIPNLPNAPFSLTLHTEWIKPLSTGGTFTVTNDRPIVRDSEGRIYMERWRLTPKGSNIPSQMSAIQIDDPIAHKFYTCFVRQKVCELQKSVQGLAHYDPNRLQSGPLPGRNGSFLHQDLGASYFGDMPVHTYRDTTTLNPGVLGNDAPMATVREFSYSAELGFNLASTLDSAQVGKQVFTVTKINTNEPDPKFFQPPEGYRILDQRKPESPTPAN